MGLRSPSSCHCLSIVYPSPLHPVRPETCTAQRAIAKPHPPCCLHATSASSLGRGCKAQICVGAFWLRGKGGTSRCTWPPFQIQIHRKGNVGILASHGLRRRLRLGAGVTSYMKAARVRAVLGGYLVGVGPPCCSLTTCDTNHTMFTAQAGFMFLFSEYALAIAIPCFRLFSLEPCIHAGR